MQFQHWGNFIFGIHTVWILLIVWPKVEYVTGNSNNNASQYNMECNEYKHFTELKCFTHYQHTHTHTSERQKFYKSPQQFSHTNFVVSSLSFSSIQLRPGDLLFILFDFFFLFLVWFIWDIQQQQLQIHLLLSISTSKLWKNLSNFVGDKWFLLSASSIYDWNTPSAFDLLDWKCWFP